MLLSFITMNLQPEEVLEFYKVWKEGRHSTFQVHISFWCGLLRTSLLSTVNCLCWFAKLYKSWTFSWTFQPQCWVLSKEMTFESIQNCQTKMLDQISAAIAISCNNLPRDWVWYVQWKVVSAQRKRLLELNQVKVLVLSCNL